MSDFGMRTRWTSAAVSRRRILQGAVATAAGGVLARTAFQAAAQEITFSRDYEGTTLNLLMEDLLETTIIEDMLVKVFEGIAEPQEALDEAVAESNKALELGRE